MNNIITIKNLTKTYDKGRTKALNDISLNIKEGIFVSIMGPSGSGKSTLLNMIGALDTPDKGYMEIAGQDISEIKDLNLFRRETVGFVFQLHNLIPNLTSRENIEIAMYGTGMSSEAMKKRSLILLVSLGLEDRVNTKPNILSGGERQRVAVARSLANNPKIILADEPTGSLDTKNGSMIIDLLKHHQKQLGATLILVTHNMQLAEQADYIIQIQDGKIITKNQ